jgi:type IV secretory pathway VirB10-like protein
MLPTTPNGVPAPQQAEPQLIDRTTAPKGVFQKNLKILLYLGAVAILVLATLLSSVKKRPATTAEQNKDSTVALVVQDNTANNVAALHAQLESEHQRQQQDALAAQSLAGTPAQQASAAAYGPNGLPVAAVPCVPGQPCSAPGYVQPTTGQGSGGQPQLSPEQQEAQQLAIKERERLYSARFASSIAYSRSSQPEQPQQAGGGAPNAYAAQVQPGQPTTLTTARAAGEQPAAQPTYKRSAEVNVDTATGQPYVIYEGLTLDAVLMNRLDGDAAGPVKVLVSNPVYSHDHQHVLIPEGTIVLGEARKIGASGIGQQRRIAVSFHRMLMPDGYSVDLDQFHGLDQIGEEGLKDKVNNHYFQIFGTSIALGVISGAAQITQGGSGYNSTGSQQFVNGASAGISQQATTILDRFIQIPPTITIREGHRVKIYFTQDLLLPAYTSHTIPQTF